MRPFSHFQPILQLDLRWPLILIYNLWPHQQMRAPMLHLWLWLKSINACGWKSQMLSFFFFHNRQQQGTKWSLYYVSLLTQKPPTMELWSKHSNIWKIMNLNAMYIGNFVKIKGCGAPDGLGSVGQQTTKLQANWISLLIWFCPTGHYLSRFILVVSFSRLLIRGSGVNLEGVNRQVSYLTDEAVSSGKGANTVISLMCYYFENYGMGKRIRPYLWLVWVPVIILPAFSMHIIIPTLLHFNPNTQKSYKISETMSKTRCTWCCAITLPYL